METTYRPYDRYHPADPTAYRPAAYITAFQPSKRGQGIWILFIHGGAWRDPRVDCRCFDKVIENLRKSKPALSSVAGCVSIDYRLAPYPAQSAANTGRFPPSARNSRHPAPVEDVLAAVRWLQDPETTPGFDENYIIVGHSAGASLAFSAFSSLADGLSDARFAKPPRAILGAAGLYDYPLCLAAVEKSQSAEVLAAYRSIFASAFGSSDVVGLSAVSPVSAEILAIQNVMLMHSSGDELVDRGQYEVMEHRLGGIKDLKLLLHEVEDVGHEEIYELGSPLADAVRLLLAVVERT